MRRWRLLATTSVLATFVGTTGVAIVAALSANACNQVASSDQPSSRAVREIPAQLLPLYEQVGTEYGIPWEVLAGIATEECAQGRLRDPSCSLQQGAVGPGIANRAGASGLMQIGVGGAAGDEYDQLRRYLPNPALGPHDPLTSVRLAALVLVKDKGGPTDQAIDAYLRYVRMYNGSGPAADAYAARVIADAHRYGAGFDTIGCLAATPSA